MDFVQSNVQQQEHRTRLEWVVVQDNQRRGQRTFVAQSRIGYMQPIMHPITDSDSEAVSANFHECDKDVETGLYASDSGPGCSEIGIQCHMGSLIMRRSL